MSETKAYREIIKLLEEKTKLTQHELNLIKVNLAREYSLGYIPSNSELIAKLRSEGFERLIPLLRRKPSRSISGVVIIAVMTKPWPCPKEEPCIYCPGGPKFGVPQSYTGHEPAAMRGIQNDYDPYLQVLRRMEQYRAIGQSVDKVELIVMGGTFPATPVEYQEWFIKRCLDAIAGKDSHSLEEAKRNAEFSDIHNVGITIETRPDWAGREVVDRMLNMGVTRVELGVQNIYDDIYQFINRGHEVKDVVEATRILKDSGLKVCYHLMPGLPESSFDRDLEAFKKIFTDSNFKPDSIKIYPCLVLKGTKLYELWKRGKYRPYTTEEAVELLVQLKKIIPPWVRIMRVQRDIPAKLIVDGVKKSNLRQLVWKRMEELGLKCRCIRCREVGHKILREGIWPDIENLKLRRIEEEASGGKDIFLALEDVNNDILIGYLRLRIPSPYAHREEIKSERTAIVRELKVLGSMLPVGEKPKFEVQHRGYGRTLLRTAEEIAMDYGASKIVVISALGTKRYYINLGYTYDGPYVSKCLEN